MKIFISGASGFIGRYLCIFLKKKGCFIKGGIRNRVCNVPGADEYIQVDDINETTDWQQALTGVDTVIHLAARVHVMDSRFRGNEELDAFRRVNVLGTERLARMAAKEGVKRFIFISSIGVNGERTDKKYFTENDAPNPISAYAISKWEAEQILFKVAEDTGLKVVVLRLPLVYGLDAPGNFSRFMKLIKKGIPLPLGKIKNLRSFIYIGNLVDAINVCITHPLAVGETFLVSDGQDISTPDLMKMIATAMNKKLILLPLPSGILKVLAACAGQGQAMEKLTGSLRIDSSKIRNLLGWKPPFTLYEGIRETVK